MTEQELQTGYRELEQGFMRPEITEQHAWVELDTSDGLFYVPFVHGWTNLQYYKDCVTGEVYSTQVIRKKHGARLSASGYLDCTDWTIHDTVKEAMEYLVETYAAEYA